MANDHPNKTRVDSELRNFATRSEFNIALPQPANLHAPSTPAPPKPLTILGLFRGLRRRWKRACAVGAVLAFVAAAAVWVYLPPTKPSAYMKLYFPSRQEVIGDHPDPPLNQATQRELLLSRLVIRGALADPAIAELDVVKQNGDPVSWLNNELQVEFPGNSEVMKISLSGDRPEEIKAVVDAVARSYMARVANQASGYRNTLQSKLEHSLAEARAEYEAAKLKAGEKFSPIGAVTAEGLGMRQTMYLQNKKQAEADLRKVAEDIKQLEANEAEAAARLAEKPIKITDDEADAVVSKDEVVRDIKKAIQAKKLEIRRASDNFTPTSPQMKRLAAEQDGLEKDLAARRDELRKDVVAQVQKELKAKHDAIRLELIKARREHSAKEIEAAKWEQEYDAIAKAAIGASGTAAELTKKQMQFEELEAKFRRLRTDFDAPSRVQPLEEEAVVLRPSDLARRTRMAGTAAVGAFGFALVAMAFLEFRTRRVETPREVEDDLGVRVVGTLPASPARGALVGGAEVRWESLLNEAVDSARTVFLHAATNHQMRVVMVTSAAGGEGKTSVSCRLAASLARSGRKTLLIDADLRSPDVAEAFEVAPGPGVCEFLRGEANAMCIQATALEGLWVMPAGRCDSEAVTKLSRGGFAKLLADVRQGFDAILIDSSPLLPVADGLVIAKHCDGVLLSVMCDVSQTDRVSAACQRLAALGVPLLGAVVNGTRAETYGYGPAAPAAATA